MNDPILIHPNENYNNNNNVYNQQYIQQQQSINNNDSGVSSSSNNNRNVPQLNDNYRYGENYNNHFQTQDPRQQNQIGFYNNNNMQQFTTHNQPQHQNQLDRRFLPPPQQQQQQQPPSTQSPSSYSTQFDNNNNNNNNQRQQQLQQQQSSSSSYYYPPPSNNNNNNNNYYSQQQQQQNINQPTTNPNGQLYYPNNNNNNNNDLIQRAYQILSSNLNADELKTVKERLEKTIEALSEDCVLSHLMTQLYPNNIRYPASDKVYNIFQNHFAKKIEDRHERVFESFCSPCTVLKLGLITDNITKPMESKSCTFNPSRSGNAYYNFGKFIHGIASYNVDRNKHPDMGNYSETIAFPPGIIILPSSKIITQITGMEINKITHGVKVCMINSEEKNVTNGTIMARFLARNKKLDCGYYIRDKSLNMQKYNTSTKGIKTKKNEMPDISELYTQLKMFLDKYNRQLNKVPREGNPNRPFGTSKDHDDKTDVNDLYIASVDDDDVFDADNIFQNGEPMKRARPDEKYDPQDIGMRVFDVNPALIAYLVNMINIQSLFEEQHKKDLEKKKKNTENTLNKLIDKETHFLSGARLVNHTYYDFLCLAFFNEIYHEKLCELPPFNGECILSHSNILFVNKHGDSIMIDKNPDIGKCTMYNRLIKLMEGSSIKNKFISTASNTSLTQSGRVPRAAFTPEAINQLFQGMIKGDDQKDKLLEHEKKLYNEFVTQNANIFKDEHNKIKNSSDIFQNYFCEFLDDANEPVDFENNEIVYDTARKIYPQTIIDNRKNRLQVSLDYSVKNDDMSIIDEQHQPNVVYAKNLGMISLISICNHSPLVLKNASVLLPNLRNRFTKNRNAIISNISSGCKRKAGNYDDDDDDDDLDGLSLPKSTIIADMPEKKKPMPGTIELTGEEPDFDFQAHLRRKECQGPSVRNLMDRYAQMSGSSPCLRGI